MWGHFKGYRAEKVYRSDRNIESLLTPKKLINFKKKWENRIFPKRISPGIWHWNLLLPSKLKILYLCLFALFPNAPALLLHNQFRIWGFSEQRWGFSALSELPMTNYRGIRYDQLVQHQPPMPSTRCTCFLFQFIKLVRFFSKASWAPEQAFITALQTTSAAGRSNIFLGPPTLLQRLQAVLSAHTDCLCLQQGPDKWL